MMIESHIAISRCTPLSPPQKKEKKITDKMNSSSTEASSQPPMIPIILTSIYDSSENICKPQVVYCGMMMIVMMIIHNALLFAVEKFSPSLPWYLDNVVLDFAVTFKMYSGTIWIQTIAPQISVGVIDNFTMKGMTYFNFICHPIHIHIFHFVFNRRLFSLKFWAVFHHPLHRFKGFN